MRDKIKVSVFRNYRFNWTGKLCLENCNRECAKYSKKGAKCYGSSEKEKLLPGEKFLEDPMEDEVIELSFEE